MFCSSTAVHIILERLTHCESWITVHGLNNLHALIKDNPVGVNLSLALWVQHDSLIGSEVCQCDLCILRASVNPVNHMVQVEVSSAGVAHPII